MPGAKADCVFQGVVNNVDEVVVRPIDRLNRMGDATAPLSIESK